MTQNKQLSDHYIRSLNRNIILIIIVVSVIPLILVSSTIYYQFRTSYHEKVYDHLRELVHSHSPNIDYFLQEKLSDIRSLTAGYGRDKLEDESFLQERLIILQKNFGKDFVDLGVINADGKQTAYAGPFKLAKADYADAGWFRRSIQSEFFISDVFLGLRGMPHFIIAVRNSHQEGHWILRATIDFVRFTNLVENIRLGETGFAFILNKTGELQTTPISRPSIEVDASRTIYTELLSRSAVIPEEPRVAVKSDSNQNKNIYIAALLKNGDWLLVYQQRMADAFADLNKTFMLTTALMFLGLVAIIIMAFTLSKAVVRRVARADSEKQLMSKKVIEASKLASVGELAAGIAHEINNPVAIMVEEAGWIGDLMEDVVFDKSEDRSEFERAIIQIQTQGKRCKEITHKLLSFARQTDSTVQDVDIKTVIEEMVALSSQRTKYSLVQIRTEVEQNLPSIRASISELQQVFFNLINNAIDAMENQGGTLTISCKQQNSFIVIKISDTGKGIPEANLDRIFDPFFTTKPVGKGTGLGLSICYGIIEKMGGKIDVQSKVGSGTTFLIYLPLQPKASRLGKEISAEINQ
ncbi:MAG: GHKL domain-containing protein [Deltaproteobacteria bacterium]|nr:GHKL domain-containing protein [Deltaproteobacteria bacterium]